MGVEGEGKGRVFTRKREIRQKTRRREKIATTLDLELPLLRLRQHETATRSAVALASIQRGPRFLVAHGSKTGGIARRTLIRLSLTQGFRLVSPSVRRPHRGGGPGLACRAPERGTTGTFDRQQALHTVGIPQWQAGVGGERKMRWSQATASISWRAIAAQQKVEFYHNISDHVIIRRFSAGGYLMGQLGDARPLSVASARQISTRARTEWP